jgi:mono/diheme cytochrome c family protein
MSHNNPGEKESRPRERSLTIVLLAFVICIASMPKATAQTAKATEDLPAGAMQAKAIASCQECHEARIVMQQRLSKAAWTKEVDKMIKWGAVVDANDRDALIDYLSTNFSVDKPPYDPPRSSPASKKTMR